MAALGFTLLIAVVTGLVVGWRRRCKCRWSADRFARATRIERKSGAEWMRGVLVVSEIAFACVLLVGAGLLMRSFMRVLDVI